MITYLIIAYLIAIGIALEEYYQEKTVSWYSIKHLFFAPLLLPIIFGMVFHQHARELDNKDKNNCKCKQK